jgi:hypothetical protein
MMVNLSLSVVIITYCLIGVNSISNNFVEYVGCFNAEPIQIAFGDPTLTKDSCFDTCSGTFFQLRKNVTLDYIFAGLQIDVNSTDGTCFCTNCIGFNGPANPSLCDNPCGPDDNCGGEDVIAFYRLSERDPLGSN